jgi:hypothetical protein
MDRAINHKDNRGNPKCVPPLEQIVSRMMRGATLPSFFAFITDGGNSDRLHRPIRREPLVE